jgi:hypothetical protein
MSKAEPSFGNTRLAHYRGNIIKPVSSLSRAWKTIARTWLSGQLHWLGIELRLTRMENSSRVEYSSGLTWLELETEKIISRQIFRA